MNLEHVLVHTGTVDEEPLANGAGVFLLSRVLPHVELQLAAVVASVCAVLALEGPVPRVTLHVLIQNLLESCAEVADGALKLLFVAVFLCMVQQLDARHKGGATRLAAEVADVVMAVHVTSKRVLRLESLIADGAYELGHVGVNALVAFVFLFMLELFATLGAREIHLVAVGLQMAAEGTGLSEPAVAFVALVRFLSRVNAGVIK